MIAEASSRGLGVVALVVLALLFAPILLRAIGRLLRGVAAYDRSFLAELRDRLKSWGQFAVTALRGDHGRNTQILAVGALVCAAVVMGSTPAPIAAAAVCATLVVYMSTKHREPQVASASPLPPPPPVPPSPPPPPPPRAATPPSPPHQPWAPGGREYDTLRRNRFNIGVALAVFAFATMLIGGAMIAFEKGSKRVSRAAERIKTEVRRELAQNPEFRAEVEKWIDDPELRRQIFPPPILAPPQPPAAPVPTTPPDAPAPPQAPDVPLPPEAPVAVQPPERPRDAGDLGRRIRRKVKEAVVQEAVDAARSAYALVSDDGASAGEAEARDVPVVYYLPDGEFEVPQPPARVVFTTVECGTQQEADHRLVKQVSRFLTLALAKSGKRFDAGSWQPSLDWTARNFAADRTIHTRQNQQTGAALFAGAVAVDAPDDKKVEMIWKHYLDDQASSRSRGLLKAYAGAVFVVGGLAVLLRLGTGRRIQPREVSYQQRKPGRPKFAIVAAVLIFAALLAAPLFVGWLLAG